MKRIQHRYQKPPSQSQQFTDLLPMAIITRKQTIEKIEPPRLDKYIFKSFRNDEGYVIFTNLIAKRHEMEQLIYYLFKDEYQHFEKPMIIYVLNQSEFIQYDLLQPNQTYDVFIADSMIAGDFIALQAKPDFKLEDIIGQPDLVVFSENEYEHLIQQQTLQNFSQEVQGMQDGISGEYVKMATAYDEFLQSTQKRRQILKEQTERIREKRTQVEEYAQYVQWTAKKYQDLEQQMVKLLRENEITLLDPVFGNTIEQKSQIQRMSQKKLSQGDFNANEYKII